MMAGAPIRSQGLQCKCAKARISRWGLLYLGLASRGAPNACQCVRLDLRGSFGRVRGRGCGVGDEGPPGRELRTKRALELTDLVRKVALGGASREGLSYGGKCGHETASPVECPAERRPENLRVTTQREG